MVPLPIALYSKIASPLQLLASRVASTVMNATGVPVLCEGNRMTLPGGLQMFVAEACSGMRQLTGFLALTTAVAYLTTRPAWYRVIIVISALPIALSANIARVMLTGYIMHFVNPQFALGTYHTLEGLLMMGFGLLLLQCECWVLDQIFQIAGRGGQPASEPDTPRRGRWRSARLEATWAAMSVERNGSNERRSGEEERCRRLQRAVLCGAILSTGLAAQAGLERLNQTDRPPLRQSAGLDSAGHWQTGSARTSRSTPRSSSEPRPPSISTGPTRAASSRACAFASGSTILAHGNQPAAHAGDLPSVRRLDQDRVADSRAHGARSDRTGRSRSRGWVTGEVNWSSTSDSGTTSSEKGSWRTTCGSLPITSRSSHGRTTRGSSMTVEVFYPGDNDPEGEALREFARELVKALEPILPLERAVYHVP